MSANSQSPTWPYVAMVAALFLGSVLATQTYRQPDSEEVSVDIQGSIDIQGPSATAVVALEVPRVAPYQPPPPREPLTPPLAEFTSPASVARIAPPVADRIPPEVIHVEPQRTREAPAEPLTSSPRALIAQRINELPELSQSTITRHRRGLAAPQNNPVWPFPRSLAEQLAQVGQHPQGKEWSLNCLTAINQLTAAPSLQSPQAAQILLLLQGYVAESTSIANQSSDAAFRSQLLRTGYSLQRRVKIWSGVNRLAKYSTTRIRVSDTDQNMAQIVSQAQTRLRNGQSESWIAFLGLDEANGVIQSPHSNSSHMRQHATRILSRLRNTALTERQRDFLKDAAIAAYIEQLHHWATEPIDYPRLLAEVEEFEQTRREKAGEVFANRISAMQWSELEIERELASNLATYYRNANLRMSLSQEFVNRLLPTPDRFYEDVNDYVVGAHVIGRAQTSADLKLSCVPSHSRWQLTLEARGFVASETSSRRGPVTTFQDGLSEYLVRKHVSVDPHEGVLVSPSEAIAASDSDLVGLRTDFDAIPLLNLLARSIALQQYDSTVGSAKFEVEDKVASRASQRVDEEIELRLREIRSKLETSVLGPLTELKLRPIATDMKTLDDQLVGRFRLADRDQLGAFTPRPREPENCAISVQLHESALNNAVEGMELAGKRFELTDLFRKLSRLANAEKQKVVIPEEMPRNVYVTFVDEDPIRVRFQGGRMHLSIDLKSLEVQDEDREWGRFGIDVYYRPDPQQVEANLVRDGVIELRGQMSFRDRIPLRAVFGKIFAKSKAITLLNDHLRREVRLQGLAVNQFVLEEGWLGLAISGKQVAETPGPIRR